MKELNIFQATELTSPNPLTLICTQKDDGSTNMAPICFVSYLSFNPPMMSFATGKQSATGEQARKFGKAVITVPSVEIAQAAFGCGTCSGKDTDKIRKFSIEMKSIEGTDIRIPTNTRLAFVVEVTSSIDVGDHILHICSIKAILGDDSKQGVYAWNGFGKIAPAIEQ